ncbi:hypothetical protein DFH09DRAFT_1356728 [Mycena vulgaris]|nr:hypothetical protein DFH09DRAFT_1356728 [Mycena vulgaris]
MASAAPSEMTLSVNGKAHSNSFLEYEKAPWYLRVPFVSHKSSPPTIADLADAEIIPEADCGFFSKLTFASISSLGYAALFKFTIYTSCKMSDLPPSSAIKSSSISTGVLLRGGLIAALYKESLHLTSRTRTTVTNGKLITHFGTDVHDIDTMTASVIFTSLTLFQLLKTPMMMLPVSFGGITDAYNATTRVYPAFMAETLDETRNTDTEPDAAVAVKGGAFTWDGPPPSEDDSSSAKKKKGRKRKTVSFDLKNADVPEPVFAPQFRSLDPEGQVMRDRGAGWIGQVESVPGRDW